MKRKIPYLIILGIILTSFKTDKPSVGTVIDSYNGVNVYYNGDYDMVHGRNLTRSGYNLGLKYQCVEFIKRYYYQRFQHRMPNTYGHAVDFFDQSSNTDVKYNTDRNLYQYWNGSYTPPIVDDILVFKTEGINPFGHIGIISKVTPDYIEMVQQNYGTKSRITFSIKQIMGRYYINDKEVLGWLSRKHH